MTTEHLRLLFGDDPDKSVVPQFLLEIVLRDGSRFFMHSLALFDEDDDLVIVRVWDFRTIGTEELVKLKLSMNETWSKDAYKHHEKIHPQLDWGILSFAKQDLVAVLEWADRYWPVEMQTQRLKLGFRLDESARNFEPAS